MGSHYFIKAYPAELDDLDIATLTDHAWRRYHEINLMACEIGLNGQIPDATQIAWRLRIPADQIPKLEDTLEQLKELGLIIPNKPGSAPGWQITRYPHQQAPASSTERSRQRRARQKGELYQPGPGAPAGTTGNETSNDSSQDPATKRPTEDRRQKIEIDNNNTNARARFSIYFDGVYNPKYRDQTIELIEHHAQLVRVPMPDDYNTWKRHGDSAYELLKLAGYSLEAAKKITAESIDINKSLDYQFGEPASILTTARNQIIDKLNGGKHGETKGKRGSKRGPKRKRADPAQFKAK